ncbi:MAG: ROK family protein [Planctomycetes bacterium]|nr:ROK family protein [Planctomycetota bacterium]MCB9904617.1 ROK family protein [Planctomycetota bacterium]
MSTRHVGIDIGGTAIKAGAVDADGRIQDELRHDPELARGPEHVVKVLAKLARALGATDRVGLGVPGLVDRTRGLVTVCPNLAPLEGFPLRTELARELDIDEAGVAIENDANAAALGEHWLGGAREERDVAVITLGTGVGGGLILGGELFVGPSGLAGEIGHLCVDPSGPLCGCGSRGCVEALASATAAARRARDAGLDDDLARLAERARAAEGPERVLLRDIGRDLGRGLATVLVLLDVRAYLIGGGFGAALDVLHDGILDGLIERSWGRSRESLRILPATLGPRAGWVGAARLVARD